MSGWPVPDALPGAEESQLQIWALPLDLPADQVAHCRALLSRDEVERADRFLRPADRRRFAVARGCMRLLLGAYAGQEAALLRFSYGPRGKPWLAQPGQSQPVTFNLSHSHEMAVAAFTRVRRVGVDLEYVHRPVRLIELAASVFSEQEQTVLQALPPQEQVVAFYNGWTRKEAFIKALGDGLSYPLQSFDVSLAPGEPARLLRVQDEPGSALLWQLLAFTAGSDYIGAAALEGEPVEVAYWCFNLEAFQTL